MGLALSVKHAPRYRDIAWLLQDWRLTDDGTIDPGFGSLMDAAMSGRVGNVVTVNGAPPSDLAVRASLANHMHRTMAE